MRVVTATEAKNRFGALIKSAYASDEHLIVEKSGIPVVAIIPMADYQALVSSQAVPTEVAERVAAEQRRAEAGRRLKEVMDRVHARMPDIPPEEEEEVERMIQREVDAVRAARARKLRKISRKPRTRAQVRK
ncbi:MAG: type II toxin-antitoxin system Phd/YefM family antitoxin [Chloroflexi bacterium]|nr:type II toxin-antitoxin system Phd/YefM family antitoxin [Chloroflexota bacterium]